MTKNLTRGAAGSSPRSHVRLAEDDPILRSSGSAHAKRRDVPFRPPRLNGLINWTTSVHFEMFDLSRS